MNPSWRRPRAVTSDDGDAAQVCWIINSGCTCSPHCEVKQGLASVALDDLEDLKGWLEAIRELAPC